LFVSDSSACLFCFAVPPRSSSTWWFRSRGNELDPQRPISHDSPESHFKPSSGSAVINLRRHSPRIFPDCSFFCSPLTSCVSSYARGARKFPLAREPTCLPFFPPRIPPSAHANWKERTTLITPLYPTSAPPEHSEVPGNATSSGAVTRTRPRPRAEHCFRYRYFRPQRARDTPAFPPKNGPARRWLVSRLRSARAKKSNNRPPGGAPPSTNANEYPRAPKNSSARHVLYWYQAHKSPRWPTEILGPSFLPDNRIADAIFGYTKPQRWGPLISPFTTP